MRKLAATVIFLSFIPCGLLAARLMLRDGTVIYGQFLSGSPQTIVFQEDNGMRHRFDINQIQTIDFGGPATGGSSDRGAYGTYPDGQPQPSPAYPPATTPMNDRYALLQPGTQIAVRTDEKIEAQNATEGQAYSASIAQDVIDRDGRILIPRGSAATLVIRQVNAGGALSNGNLVLDLDTVRVNGHRYRVSTADVVAGDANGIGKNKRTAEMVGGGAVLGTLLGAIAGGGKGAAIGALAGGAAGGGVQVLTKGREIRVPAETVLNFQLDRPLELREMR